MSEPLLSVRDLRVYFHQRDRMVRAVDGVDLRLDPGKTLCLVGESGSGKSLTALSIMRLISPPGRIEEGSEITYAGRDLVAASAEQMQSIRGNEISMIFQEPMTSLNPAHTVGAQIAEAVRLHRPVSKAAAAERALEMLRLVGVPDPRRRASDYPHQLSGGMRQRVMIAMALSCEPEADHRGRADDRARRHHPGPGPRAAARAARHAGHGGAADHARPGRGGRDVPTTWRSCTPGGSLSAATCRTPSPGHSTPTREALLRSIPVLGMRQDQRLTVIPGMVPSPASWPSGCRFEARCDQAFDRCVEYPPLFDVGRAAACWHRDPAAVVRKRRR